MACLKFTHPADWDAIEAHLLGARGEWFAFAYTRQHAVTDEGPILEVVGVDLIDEHDAVSDGSGWYLADAALDRVHNAALTQGHGLVELHSHRLGPPAFSPTDEDGLAAMADYVTGLLPDRTYGAGDYAAGRVHVEYWCRSADGLRRGRFRSVTVYGDHLRVLNAPLDRGSDRLARQTSLLGELGSATLSSLRVAVVGAGGTWSHAALALAYLGISEVLVLDDDHAEVTNLNRLVTAGHAEIGAPKPRPIRVCSLPGSLRNSFARAQRRPDCISWCRRSSLPPVRSACSRDPARTACRDRGARPNNPTFRLGGLN